MEVFYREPTSATPFVLLDPESGIGEISGRSIPVDAESFYRPILDWFEILRANPPAQFNLHLKLDFFNIASSKRILYILYKLQELQKLNKEILVHWHYPKDDQEMLEVGQDYAYMIGNIIFRFKHYQPHDISNPTNMRVGWAS